MRMHVASVVVLLIWMLTFATACQPIQVDVVSVGVKGEQYYSNLSLANGEQYIIRVEGTFRFDEPIGKLADAEYVKDGETWEYRGKRSQPIGIMINGIGYPGLTPTGEDRANHVYTYTWTGAGTPIWFSVQDNNYADNSGVLTARIMRRPFYARVWEWMVGKWRAWQPWAWGVPVVAAVLIVVGVLVKIGGLRLW